MVDKWGPWSPQCSVILFLNAWVPHLYVCFFVFFFNYLFCHQVCCVTCCGQTQTKTSRVGGRMTGESLSPLGPMWSASFSTATTWTSSAEPIRYRCVLLFEKDVKYQQREFSLTKFTLLLLKHFHFNFVCAQIYISSSQYNLEKRIMYLFIMTAANLMNLSAFS